MWILGFSAKARHGKDTCNRLAQEIAAEHGVNMGQYAMAWPLKARVYAMLSHKYSWDDIMVKKPDEVRRILQQEGTEKGRNLHGLEFWTRHAMAFLRFFKEGMPFMQGVGISDIRFPNEVAFVRFGGEVEPDALDEISQRVLERLDYTAERERDLLENDIEQLIELDRSYFDLHVQFLEEKYRQAPGLSLYIASDRPTLTGDAAQHPSETALDNLSKEQEFDGIITNNLDTPLDELKEQIRPYVLRLINDHS